MSREALNEGGSGAADGDGAGVLIVQKAQKHTLHRQIGGAHGAQPKFVGIQIFKGGIGAAGDNPGNLEQVPGNLRYHDVDAVVVVAFAGILAFELIVALVIRTADPQFVRLVVVADEAVTQNEGPLVRTHLLRGVISALDLEDGKLRVAALDRDA